MLDQEATIAGARGVAHLLPTPNSDRLRRVFDIVGALLGLVLLWPLLAAVAMLVRLDSRGPALFRQVRVGRFGKDFVLYKFRTMTPRAGTETGSFDVGDVSRVTRLGAILRRTKLDELPQLWNVLRGDMALVGPRPEVRKWIEAYPERWARVQTVRPGITDPGSIVYRHEECILAADPNPEQVYRTQVLSHKLDLYEDYVRTRTLSGDMVILWRTALAVTRFSNRNPW